MMYFSETNTDYLISVELDDNSFLDYLKEIDSKISSIESSIISFKIKYDTAKARLLDRYNYSSFFECRDEFLGVGEDALSYYGFDISKEYSPKDGYWEELRPDKVHLDSHYNHYGFSFFSNGVKYAGMQLCIEDWDLKVT